MRRATVKRSITIPGSKPDNIASAALGQQGQSTRPDSIERRTLTNGYATGGDTNPTRTSSVGRENNATYENWPLTPSPLHTKPLPPPPPVAQRHKISASPEDSIAYGHQTDSFIVPNLHQSQFISAPVGEDSQVKISPAHVVQKPNVPPDKPKVKERSSDALSSNEPILVDSQRNNPADIPVTSPLSPSELKSIESSTEEKATPPSSTYSPRMHTKLAKMTKIPTKQVSPPLARKPGPSKSFSQLEGKMSPTFTSPPHSSIRVTKTLPRKPQENESGAELLKKLQERRQKLEKQLSGEIPPVATDDNRDSTSSGEGVLRWTGSNKEMESTNLSKFGIIEEGGSYVV